MDVLVHYYFYPYTFLYLTCLGDGEMEESTETSELTSEEDNSERQGNTEGDTESSGRLLSSYIYFARDILFTNDIPYNECIMIMFYSQSVHSGNSFLDLCFRVANPALHFGHRLLHLIINHEAGGGNMFGSVRPSVHLLPHRSRSNKGPNQRQVGSRQHQVASFFYRRRVVDSGTWLCQYSSPMKYKSGTPLKSS